MRADRLLSIMLLLRTRDRVTATELAERLEVSERTILRDMEALSAAGVPVYADRGRSGGFSMLDGFRADVSDLTPMETQVLFAYLGLDTFGDLGLSRQLGSALDKLAVNATLGDVNRLREVVHVDRRRWFAGTDDVTHLPGLRRACADRRRVRIRYQSPRDDRPVSRVLDPLGVVENGNRWYLVAYHQGEPRSYRLARVRAVTVLDAPARLPDGASLASVWESLRSAFETGPEPTHAVLRIPAELEDAVPTVLQGQLATGHELSVIRRDAGSVDVSGAYRFRQAVIGMCLGYAGQVQIVAPADLRHEAARVAIAAANAHTTSVAG